jgi:DNA-binding response OmpR family regulator
MPTLLLVDDDKVFSPLLKEFLESKGFSSDWAQNADQGLELFKSGTYDLCILDIKMPFKSGLELAQEITAIDPQMSFLFLTGENQKETRLQGLSLGADDYITKPFSMEELELRIQNILRRVQKQKTILELTELVNIGKYEFDPISRHLSFQGEIQKLSETESRLLQLFCTSSQGQISRSEALHKIWNDEAELHGRSLNVYISKLRKYLAQDSKIEILNLHGTGYRLIVK